MLSAQDIAAVKVAIAICNNPELKRDILFAPVSDSLCEPDSDDEKFSSFDNYDSNEQWFTKVSQNATVMVNKLGLISCLQEKVVCLVVLIGLKMLTWAVYHKDIIGLPLEFSINFLNSSLFDARGIIDGRKAAEQLISNTSLSIKQQYKLSCFYCFADKIPALFNQLSGVEQKEFYDSQNPKRVKQAQLVKVWTYYTIGEIDKLIGKKSLHQYFLEKAIGSGIKSSVEYCLDRAKSSRQEVGLITVAVDTVKNNLVNGTNDMFVFCNCKFDFGYKAAKIPYQYSVDILSFLFSKMREDEVTEFLRRDVDGVCYGLNCVEMKTKHSRVLSFLLKWPNQDCFMKIAKLMWEFLPVEDYSKLIMNICCKIMTVRWSIGYWKDKSYNYRKLLREFWCESPAHFKRFFFCDKTKVFRPYIYDDDDDDEDEKVEFPYIVNEGKELLVKLFLGKTFTIDDRKNIELILDSTTEKEKESIVLSKEAKSICLELIKNEKWDRIDLFLSNCISSKADTEEFKRGVSITHEARQIFLDFTKNKKWDATEIFIRWSALSKEEINKLKREIIYSSVGKEECCNLILLENSVKDVEKFCFFYLSSDEICDFKKKLIYSCDGLNACRKLVCEDKVKVVDEFISWSLTSVKEITEIKKKIADKEGGYICTTLLSGWDYYHVFDDKTDEMKGCLVKFKGGKWKQVETFLAWCFSSDGEIIDYKRKILFELFGTSIHFNLIYSHQYEEAERFFSWLGLSFDEIRTFKIETLFDKRTDIYESVVDVDGKQDSYFHHTEGKWENIKLFLRWCLVDSEAVKEFKFRFDIINPYGFVQLYESEEEGSEEEVSEDEVSEEKRIVINKFNLLLEELHNDLSQISEDQES